MATIFVLYQISEDAALLLPLSEVRVFILGPEHRLMHDHVLLTEDDVWST